MEIKQKRSKLKRIVGKKFKKFPSFEKIAPKSKFEIDEYKAKRKKR